MKTTVEKLSPTRAKLTIAVTPDELKPSITHAYEHIAAEVTIPGFRKGKVPPAIIDSRVGKAAVLDHAINDGLGDIYTQAVNEEKLSPLGQPAVDVVTVPDLKDFSGDLEVTFEVDVRPDITIPAYDGIAVTVDAADITPDDVENELDRLRSRFGTLVTVDRPAQAGDFAQLSLSADIAGNIVDTADNISYEVGSGDLIEGIDEALDGLSAGETTTFKSTLLGGDHEGEEAEITVTLSAVKVRELPEADDYFAQIASEFDTIGELRESLRGEAARAKAFHRTTKPAASSSTRCSRRSTSRCPLPSSRTRGTATSKPRTASRTTCTGPRSPSPARRRCAPRSSSTRSRGSSASRSTTTS